MVSSRSAHELSATLSSVLVPQPLVRGFRTPPVVSVLHAAVSQILVDCSQPLDDCSPSEAHIKFNISFFIRGGGGGGEGGGNGRREVRIKEVGRYL